MARGGKVDHTFAFSTNRGPHGPGVVASAGASAAPSSAETGNTGVFGQGGDEVAETRTNGDGQTFVVGPAFPGAGVVGRGGISLSNHEVANGPVVPTENSAAGIVGIAGGLNMPLPAEYSGAGVFGKSNTGPGVSGLSASGIGVVGAAITGPGVSIYFPTGR